MKILTIDCYFIITALFNADLFQIDMFWLL